MITLGWNLGRPIIANRLLLSLRRQHSKDCGLLVSREATALVFNGLDTQEEVEDVESELEKGINARLDDAEPM